MEVAAIITPMGPALPAARKHQWPYGAARPIPQGNGGKRHDNVPKNGAIAQRSDSLHAPSRRLLIGGLARNSVTYIRRPIGERRLGDGPVHPEN